MGFDGTGGDVSEFVECDSCTAKLSVDALTLYKIENIGVAQSFGTMMVAHACSPECIEEIGRRVSRKRHGLNPIVGNPDMSWSPGADGSETEERHQVTIWNDVRGGGMDPRFDEAAREMAKLLKPGHGDPPFTHQSQGREEPRRRRGDVPFTARLRDLSSSFRRCFGLRERDAD